MDQVSYLALTTQPTTSTLFTGCIILVTLAFVLRRVVPSWFGAGTVRVVGPISPGRVGRDETMTGFVDKHVPSLKAGFKPSWWLPNGHLQTIYSAMADFNKDDQMTYERKLLRLPDGGTIGVDIYPPLSMPLPEASPVVLLNHGLTGGSHESYVRNMVLNIAKPWSEGGLGGRVAVVNFRGCANTPLTSPHLYSSGNTVDTHTATLFLSQLFPRSPFFGIGFSLGAAVMTRYLGEQGSASRLKAACVLCAPLELRYMTAKLDARRLWPKLYSYSMARKMLRSLLPHLLVPDTPLSSPDSPLHPHLPALLSMAGRYRWTLRASHVMEAVAAKVGGSGEHFPFAGMNEFLSWACPGAWLGRIKRPTLAISAVDDPIVAGECLPYQTVQTSTHFVLAAVPHGGHLAWFDGPWSGPDRHRRWHVRPVLEFLRAAMELPNDPVVPLQVVEKEGWFWSGDAGWKVVEA